MDLNTVQYAIPETNGNLSVFLYPSAQPASAKAAGIPTAKQSLPVTIIDDGRLLKKNLNLAKKDENWVNRVQKSRHSTIEKTFILTVDSQDHIFWLEKEARS